MLMRLFAECGVGNPTLLSTEFERADVEVRVPGFIVGASDRSLYARVQAGYWQLSLDEHGVQMRRKSARRFKALVGIASNEIHALPCNHAGTASGQLRRTPNGLRARLVCDACGAHIRELGRVTP